MLGQQTSPSRQHRARQCHRRCYHGSQRYNHPEEQAGDHGAAVLAAPRLVRQHRHESKQQTHHTVLQDEGTDGDLTVRRVVLPRICQALDDDAGAGHRHQGANEDAFMYGGANGRGKAAGQHHGEQDLHDPAHQSHAAHRPQLGKAELQAQCEQQQLHAHLRQAFHLHQLFDHLQAARADDGASDEVPIYDRLSQGFQYHAHARRGGDQDSEVSY
mmetsp:Transcript_4045/g.11725  ORF Transcript_4045/g.11725 Transcript_4045/m.11725 type:complete len:215 (+) Transcript_4045:1786-2430(+)